MRVELKKLDQESGTSSENLNNFLPEYSASKLLSQIHFDHFYTSNTVQNPTPSASVNLQSTKTDDDFKFDGYNARGRPKNEADFSSLDAEDIQMVFQEMLHMTMLAPIQEPSTLEPSTSTPQLNRVRLVDSLSVLGDKNATTDSRTAKQPCETDTTERVDTNDDKCKSSTIKVDSKTNQIETITQESKPKIRKTKRPYKINKRRVKIDPSDVTSESRVDDVTKPGGNKEKLKKCTSSVSGEKTDTNIAECKEVDRDKWKAARRCLEAEHEMNVLVGYAAELLKRRWAEYLVMTRQEVAEFEARAARAGGMTPEVVDMIEDTGRYVWQLVDELRFFL